jgi:hypothetical protein
VFAGDAVSQMCEEDQEYEQERELEEFEEEELYSYILEEEIEHALM